MTVAERAHEAQLSISEMRDVIEQTKHHLLALERRQRDLETIIQLARAALTDDVAPPVERIETALRFLRTEHVL